MRFQRVVLAAAAVLGVVLCLNDLTRSLWIDEFGTLWVVEGSLATAWERATAFQGQSPLYYVLSWAAVQGLGESEVALRIPALLFGLLTIAALYRVGEEVGGRSVGRLSAALGLTSALILDASRSARPYSLALLMATVTLWGFLRAVRGARGGRALFVLGGVGLFYAHYVVSAFSAGIGAAYLVRPALRRHYPVSRFTLDVGLQAVLAIAGSGQLLALRARSESLIWIDSLSLPIYPIVLFPYLIPIVCGWLLGPAGRARQTREASTVLVLAIGVQILLLIGLGLAGTRLTAPRYMASIAIPGIVLGARAIWLTLSERSVRRTVVAVLAVICYVGANGSLFGGQGLVVVEDWRAGVERIRTMHDVEPAPVLYRSGFIEDDQRTLGLEVTDAIFSPLRSPGEDRPSWEVVPLSATWGVGEGFDAFLDVQVVGTLERSGQALVLSRGRPPVYVDPLVDWLQRRYGDRLVVEALVAERGVTTARLRLLTPGPSGALSPPARGDFSAFARVRPRPRIHGTSAPGGREA